MSQGEGAQTGPLSVTGETEATAMLRTYVRDHAAGREGTIAAYTAGVAVAGALIVAAVIPIIGGALAVKLLLFIGGMAIYFGAVALLVRRGWFHPSLPWLNVLIEVSIPAVIFVLDVSFKGPAYALTAPPLVLWSVLIGLSGLRFSPTLAVFAGALASIEYLVVYAMCVDPPALRIQSLGLVTLEPSFILIRSFFLLCAGVLAAIVASRYLAQASAALRAIRERDFFGKYILHDRLGSGGMAEVFRATYSPEGGFKKTVAVKRIHLEHAIDASFVEMFRLEAKVGSLLTHPNVVQVLDFGRHQSSYYMALEYVDGVTVSDIIRAHGNTLPQAAVAYLGAEMAAALAYIHSRVSESGEALRLVHRDVNPPNVLVSKIGEVKLSDFGIASIVGRPQMTQAGYVRGKAAYMSPEQVRGEGFDGRADLFALGVTLHELLTGQPLFPKVVAPAAREGMVLPPLRGRDDVSPQLEDIIKGLLAFDPVQRTPTGDVLRNQLLGLAGDAAPFPHGQSLLRKAVAVAVEWRDKQRRGALDEITQAM